MNESVRKTYKEQLRPTPAQERALDAVLWRCRTLYNTALEQRITAWERCHVSVSRFAQEAELKDIRAEMPEYAAIHCHVLQDVLARLDTAYQAFFRRVRDGEQAGLSPFPGTQPLALLHLQRVRQWRAPRERFPRPVEDRARRGAVDSSPGGRSQDRHRLPRGGRLVRLFLVCRGAHTAVAAHRGRDGRRRGVEGVPRHGGRPGRREPAPPSAGGAAVGEGAAPRLTPHEGQPPPPQGRRVSCPRTPDRAAPARRLPPQDRVGTGPSVRHDLHEAIQIANLTRRPAPMPDENGGYRQNGASHKAGLNKSIHDAGWGRFLSVLACTAACAGKRVEAVPPAYTSQDCSGCGERVPKSLRVRTHVCPTCGLVLDRDENAARNIQWRGQRLRGLAGLPAGMNREPMGL